MTFSVIDDKLDRSVEFIENALAKREAVEYPSLVRVVKQLYRYRTLTERVGRDEIRNILAVAKDVNLAFDRSSRLKKSLTPRKPCLRFCSRGSSRSAGNATPRSCG